MTTNSISHILYGSTLLDGDTTNTGNLTVTGNTSLSNVSVTGNTSLSNVTVASNINTTNILTTGNLTVNGTTTLQGLTTNTINTNKVFEYSFMLLPAGIIVMWTGSVAPNGWALCDGGSYTRLDGSGTIISPDLRGRFVLGIGLGSGLTNRTLGQTGGLERVQLSINEMPSHNHTMNSAGGHNHSYTSPANGTIFGGGAIPFDVLSQNATTSFNGDHTHSINNNGGSQSHENMPPFYVLAYIIKL